MLLSDVLTDLSLGELSNIKLGGQDSGGIRPEDYPKVISYINKGLISLYKIFDLSEKTVVIEQFESITEYVLNSKYATSNVASVEPIKYIIDALPAKPFTDDVLQITKVVDEKDNVLRINDTNNIYSLFTPAPNILQIDTPVNKSLTTIHFKAYPAVISMYITDPTSVEINLPEFLEPALLAFVAYRAYSFSGNLVDNKAGVTYQRYYNMCQEIRDLGLLNKDNNTNLKLISNGWV